MRDIIEIAFAILALAAGFLFGRRREKKHYEEIREREAKLLHIPIRADVVPEEGSVDAKLVMGNVVIANDRYKAFLGSLQSFFGGRLTPFETLLDRGRREAIIRLKTQAQIWGAKEIVHVRVDSSMIDNQGVEVFASGTAIK